MATPFVGMRGTLDFLTNVDPQNWRQTIYQLKPNGSTILTALMSAAKTESIENTHHNWWTRTMSAQGGTVASIYIDEALATEYVYASHQATQGIAGAVVYAKCAAAVAKEFVAGKQVILVDTDRRDVDLNGYVVGVAINGASSYVAIRLEEADDNSAVAATYNLATVDAMYVIGSKHAQGGNRPDAITWDPTQITNVTGISRTAVDLSRTAAKTKTRTGDPLADAHDQALLMHGYELEKKLLFSKLDTSSVGANGKPMYSQMGLKQFLQTYASTHVDDYTLNTSYTGAAWTDSNGGIDYVDALLYEIMSHSPEEPGMWGSDSLLALCGPGAMQGITKLVRAHSTYQTEFMESGFGMDITKWVTPAGSLNLKLYPMFQQIPRFSNTMLVVDLNYLSYIPFADDDTHLVTNAELLRKGLPVSATGKDGIDEEWLTENTWEFRYPERMYWADGIGLDNNLS